MFKTVKDGKLPTKGSKYSACVDLYAREGVEIGAGETVIIPLGVCIDIVGFISKNADFLSSHKEDSDLIAWDKFKKSHYLQLMLRSSLSKELIISGGVGVIDLDYKNEIMLVVHKPIDFFTMMNQSFEDTIIEKGQRIAQITLLEHKGYLFGIDTEEERHGGFGSTNKG